MDEKEALTPQITLPQDVMYSDLQEAHEKGTVQLPDGTVKTEEELYPQTAAKTDAVSVLKERLKQSETISNIATATDLADAVASKIGLNEKDRNQLREIKNEATEKILKADILKSPDSTKEEIDDAINSADSALYSKEPSIQTQNIVKAAVERIVQGDKVVTSMLLYSLESTINKNLDYQITQICAVPFRAFMEGRSTNEALRRMERKTMAKLAYPI